MPDETDIIAAIRKLKAQILALGEIQALLLADFAERAPQPITTLREMSNQMNLKFSDGGATAPTDHESIADIQEELDKIFAAARGRLE